MSENSEILLPPDDEKDFESLCLALWKDIWKDSNASKNGRNGQAQAGVDIFGQRNGKWFGIQCKVKKALRDRDVEEQTLKTAVEAAKQFRPPLTGFILATSGRADAKLQHLARELTQRHRTEGLFTVDVWSWDEIWRELYSRQNLLRELQRVYWPNVGLKNWKDRPRLLLFGVLIVVVFYLITMSIRSFCGQAAAELIAFIFAPLVSITGLHFYERQPKANFGRITNPGKEAPVSNTFDWLYLLGCMGLFFLTQIIAGMVLGLLGGLILILPEMASGEHLNDFIRRFATSSLLMNLSTLSVLLSYFSGGFIIGRVIAITPVKYAILSALIFAFLIMGVGLSLLEEFVRYTQLGQWNLNYRSIVSNLGLYWFLFVWLSWLGCKISTDFLPRKNKCGKETKTQQMSGVGHSLP